MMDVTTKISEAAIAAFEKKLAMLKGLGLNPEGIYMLQVGPDHAKVIMSQIEAMFISGFIEGMKYAKS